MQQSCRCLCHAADLIQMSLLQQFERNDRNDGLSVLSLGQSGIHRLNQPNNEFGLINWLHHDHLYKQ